MFPEIGRVRKGAPKTEEGWVGKDLNYFRVEFDQKEKVAEAVFRGTYGDQPDEINILLPFNSVDENFEAWREKYVAGGLVHRCDGERVMYEINSETGEPTITNGHPFKACDHKIGCVPTGRLKILIPELKRLAFLTVLTTSYHDCMNLSRQLLAILQINGRLAGVPLVLRRRPVEISTPSGPDGKRARRLKSLLSIEADPTWVSLKLNEIQHAALPEAFEEGTYPQLESPEWDDQFIDVDDNDVIEDLQDLPENDDPEPPQKVSTEETVEPTYERPLEPEPLKVALHGKAKKVLDEGIKLNAKAEPPETIKVVKNALYEVFAGPFAEEQTMILLNWLWDCGTEIGFIKDHQIKAMYDWLALTLDSGGAFIISQVAGMEADKAITYIAQLEGEQ
jgi:hypothetical protein